jgi:long-chain acyl-CoA synthetase
VAGASDRPWLSHYEAGVPAHVEIPEKTLPGVILETVRRFPERTAIVYYGKRWSYAEFWSAAGRFAQALQNEGFVAGDRIAVYLPNCPAYPIALFGILRAGLVAAQVSPLFLGQDLVRLLRDSAPRAIVTTEFLYPNLARLGPAFPLPVTYVARLREFYPFPKSLFVDRVLHRRGLVTGIPDGPHVRAWSAAVRTPGDPAVPHADPATTVALLQYTGGTTGLPKAAMLTHRNLVANALQCRAWFRVEPGKEVVLVSIPLFHIYGFTAGLAFPFLVGATTILQTRPDVGEILKLINRYHPTQFPAVPALYNAILQHPKLSRYNVRSIRQCISGSAPLPQEVQQLFEGKTGATVIEGYGLSETSPVTHANPFGGERRAGSVGLPFPDTDQKVVDAETGERSLPPGEVGELCVRGPQVMLGYYHQPDETRQVLRDGWFSTGDLARLDADGYCYIVDRKKDMINVGGLKVYPREVEEVLFQHPAVADAAVVGVQDPELGEAVKAFVVKRAGVEASAPEIIDFVRREIAHYKAPRSVEFLEALPRSGVQKVLRRELRAQAARSTVAAADGSAAMGTVAAPVGPSSPNAGSRPPESVKARA